MIPLSTEVINLDSHITPGITRTGIIATTVGYNSIISDVPTETVTLLSMIYRSIEKDSVHTTSMEFKSVIHIESLREEEHVESN